MNRVVSLFFAAVMMLPVVSYSATIHVPGDYVTIQEAIDAAANGDTVLVESGLYIAKYYFENISFKGKAITLTSEKGAEKTVIRGVAKASVITFNSGELFDSVLEGFTISNGKGTVVNSEEYGGGIYCIDSTPTIRNNLFELNSASFGGGIYCENASPAITKNIFEQNYADHEGGGICCYKSSPHIHDNVFIKNDGSWGGALSCAKSSKPIINNNKITENHATIGGGLGLSLSGSPVVINNHIHKNTATRGAGIYCSQPYTDSITRPQIVRNIITENHGTIGAGIVCERCTSLTIINNIIMNNNGTKCGGIYCEDSSELIVVNNMIIGNDGGALYVVAGSNATIVNNTIAENERLSGSALNIYESSSATVINTVFWDNEYSKEIKPIQVRSEAMPSTLNISHCIVQGGSSSVYVSTNSTLNWGPSIIDSDPLFVDQVSQDYHITYNSPCREGGVDFIATELLDFEGDTRIGWGGTADIGADEFYTHLYVTGDKTPGGSIQGKFIGLPGTAPVGLFIGSGVLPSPMPTMWGDYWLQAPYVLLGPLGSIPSNGVMVLPTTLPGSIPAPYDIPVQALIGVNADSLTNLCVLEVR